MPLLIYFLANEQIKAEETPYVAAVKAEHGMQARKEEDGGQVAYAGKRLLDILLGDENSSAGAVVAAMNIVDYLPGIDNENLVLSDGLQFCVYSILCMTFNA